MPVVRGPSFDSTSIASAKYSAPRRTLEIQFRGGDTYTYFDVPPSVYEGLLDAASKGQFFHRSIRGRYVYERVPADSPWPVKILPMIVG